MTKGILIADAGSSKTQWSFLNEEAIEPIRIQTAGVNPAHDSIEYIKKIIKEIKPKLKDYQIQRIYFYGAGCASFELKSLITTILKEELDCENVVVESDLLGAAVALFGNSSGVACILGTGSNTGLYNNGKIEPQIPSLGYILGDEGGGVALGKTLLNGIFKKNFSHELIDKFQEEYHLSIEQVIIKVYREPKPAAFIASFCPFIYQNLENLEIKNMVEQQFDIFFQKNIMPYSLTENYKLGFIGSVASNFSDLLKKSADKYKLKIHKIISNPIIELEKYFMAK